MKLNKDFILRQVAGTWVILPIGVSSVNFGGMLRLNETGAIIWKALERGENKEGLVASVMKEYDVDNFQAAADVDEFLEKLVQIGCLEM